MHQLISIADRVWYALHCLSRDEQGRPPPPTVLEARHGLSRGLIGKLIGERQREVRGPTLMRLAQALHVSTEWLLEGRGLMPTPTGIVPSRPGHKTSVEAHDERADDPKERAAAIAFARACGIDPRAVAAVSAMPKWEFSPEEWLAVIKVMAAELRETGSLSRSAVPAAGAPDMPKARSKK